MAVCNNDGAIESIPFRMARPDSPGRREGYDPKGAFSRAEPPQEIANCQLQIEEQRPENAAVEPADWIVSSI
jgi:hypothetical protein